MLVGIKFISDPSARRATEAQHDLDLQGVNHRLMNRPAISQKLTLLCFQCRLSR
jgi:hypothetical protein